MAIRRILCVRSMNSIFVRRRVATTMKELPHPFLAYATLGKVIPSPILAPEKLTDCIKCSTEQWLPLVDCPLQGPRLSCLIKALQEAIHGRWDRSREVGLLGNSQAWPKAWLLHEHFSKADFSYNRPCLC